MEEAHVENDPRSQVEGCKAVQGRNRELGDVYAGRKVRPSYSRQFWFDLLPAKIETANNAMVSNPFWEAASARR